MNAPCCNRATSGYHRVKVLVFKSQVGPFESPYHINMRNKPHAVVVGSGPLGAIAARRLTENRLKVTMVEAGTPVTEPSGEHYRNAPRFHSNPDSYLPEILPFFKFYDHDAQESGLPGASVTSVFGGQGIFWTNNSPRATHEERWDLPGNTSWDKSYRIAESYLGVTDHAFEGSFRADSIKRCLEPQLTEAGRRVIQQPFSGWMNEDESIHYLATADILEPIKDGLLTHVCGTVDRILVNDGKACGVLIEGQELIADVVFIAAGTIDTTLLLMRSEIGGPALGTHLTYHPVMIAQIVLDEHLRPPTGAADPPPRLQIPPTPQTPWNVMVLRDTSPVPPHPDDADVEENSLVEIQIFCPIENRPTNRMKLTDEGVKFDVPLSEKDRSNLLSIEKDADAIVKSLGRYRRGVERTWMDFGFAHLMGACRIGNNLSTSVVDANCRPHGTTNLYLSTVGVIPTPMAVNPTLTGAALTALSVDHFLNENAIC